MRAPAFLLGLALLAAPGLALCQTLDDARAFTLGLYRAYEHGEPDYLGPAARRVFSPRLLGLIRRDERLTPGGDVPTLDGDPICDCQDAGGLHGVRVEVAATGPGRATARAHFDLDRDARDVGLDLVAVGGRWRVDDVHTPDTPSLVRMLEQAHPPRR